MDLQNAFQAFVREEKLFFPGDKLLLAVSGGLDSVVLTELCVRLGYSLVIAHCNFGLRGAASERDEQFVAGLAGRYGQEYRVKHFDTMAYAAAHKLSVQVAARDLRYTWFAELLAAEKQDVRTGNPPEAILTAHHLDDNIETMLMHFFRGTGISGMRGMLPRQGSILRPLLFASKAELAEFAAAAGLSWVEDESNSTDKYTRNYWRHHLVPQVRKLYPAAEQNLAANLRRFRDTEVLYRQAVDQQLKKLLYASGDEMQVPVARLMQAEPLHTICYELISGYGFTADQVPELIRLAGSETGKFIRSASHRIIKNRRWFIIAPLHEESVGHYAVEKEEKQLRFDRGMLVLKLMPHNGDTVNAERDTGLLDADLLSFPLLWRRWKQGDYFYPLGMKKKKKLARFLIDAKLSATEKENTWVLVSGAHIVWVGGRRIDERFRVTAQTRNVFRVTLK